MLDGDSAALEWPPLDWDLCLAWDMALSVDPTAQGRRTFFLLAPVALPDCILLELFMEVILRAPFGTQSTFYSPHPHGPGSPRPGGKQP